MSAAGARWACLALLLVGTGCRDVAGYDELVPYEPPPPIRAGDPCGEDALGIRSVELACLGPGMKVSVEDFHSCAVMHDGEVWCWGDWRDDDITTFAYQPVPVRVEGIDDARAVYCGYGHACAVTHDGQVACWGNNLASQTGQPQSKWQFDARRVPGLEGLEIDELAVGEAHTLAWTVSGELRCWGHNASSQCGLETAAPHVVPATNAPPVVGVTTAAAMWRFSCAASGQLYCWGSNEEGQLGTGAASASTAVPQAVDLPVADDVRDIGVTHRSVYAVTTAGQAFAWGANDLHQLGIDAAAPSAVVGDPTPVMAQTPGGDVVPISHVAAIFEGNGSTSCARLSTSDPFGHNILCWGSNRWFMAGLENQYTEYPRAMPAWAIPSDADSLALGDSHTCFVRDENVWCIGADALLGDGRHEEKPSSYEGVAEPQAVFHRP